MITENGTRYESGVQIKYVELFGLSTDAKPTTNVANGSVFIEMDTKKLYFFDETNSQWRQFNE